MIVYVNGDSHSAGAEAVNPYCFAEDDPFFWAMGRRPHPENERASYGCEIANKLSAVLVCDAESAGSNDRILRTTRNYISRIIPNLLIIGWSTWEREEWLHDNTYYQVTAGGTDSVPPVFAERYRNWVIEQNETTRERKLIEWHDKIYQFHTELTAADIPHLFFNTYSDFSPIRRQHFKTGVTPPQEYDWNNCYVNPYDQDYTYYYWLQNQGCKTVNAHSYHYGADGHRKWADFLYEFLADKPVSV